MSELEKFLVSITSMGCPFERRDGQGNGITVIQINDLDFTFADGEFQCATSRTTEQMLMAE